LSISKLFKQQDSQTIEVINCLLQTIVDKYLIDYKGMEEYFKEEKNIISQKLSTKIQDIIYQPPVENSIWTFEALINSLIHIFTLYPSTISIIA
jgi:hypothetical protein